MFFLIPLHLGVNKTTCRTKANYQQLDIYDIIDIHMLVAIKDKPSAMITNEIIESYLNCKHKAILKNKKEVGCNVDYEHFLRDTKFDRKQQFIKRITTRNPKSIVSFSNFSENKINNLPIWILNPIIKTKNLWIEFDCIELTNKNNTNIYTPIQISPFEKIREIEKLELFIKSKLFEKHLNVNILIGQIVYGKEQRITTINLKKYFKKGDLLFREIEKLSSTDNNNQIILNKHCQICEFQEECRKIQIEKDDLSLLKGISQTEILKLNKLGVFTITQLSYLFKPKKRKTYNITNRNLWSLKSLAIREKKTFIISKPDFLNFKTTIYIDFEGLPDENFIYLIGVLIIIEDITEFKYFWANNKSEEEEIFAKLFSLINGFEDFVIYHYGSYEISELNKLIKKTGDKYSENISNISSKSVNILSYFRTHVYPPTYSNSLKEIANYLGFKWTTQNATGINSIIWRKNWEKQDLLGEKNKIIQYNKDDCSALRIIHLWLYSLTNSAVETDHIDVHSMPKETQNKFGNLNSLIKDFNDINECAWFDYQRTKIYIRTDKNIKKITTFKEKKVKKKLNITKQILIDERRICPKCGNKFPHKARLTEKTVIDLMIKNYTIKRECIRYIAKVYLCRKCNTLIHPLVYYDLGRHKYGYNLKCWCLNMYINHRVSFMKISEILLENFSIDVSKSIVYSFKHEFAQRFSSAIIEIKDEIFKGTLIHTDETKINLIKERGYVWVFTNMNTVYFTYRSSRETDFLIELLSEFKGVLISDFYTGYDALDCRQQKCLIHLIRDMNDDLLKNQFDEEFKLIVMGFSILLKKIMGTIDKYGLKKLNLSKHKQDVEAFYKEVIYCKYKSKLANKYNKRLNKYKDKLFVFLNENGVPWNNNNAEHTIKNIAVFRDHTDGHHTQQGIDDSLVLLSIFQTCKYRNINFFNFLLSKEKSISSYQQKFTMSGKLKMKYRTNKNSN
jgi:predicted RecB family nuclease